jgi:hypothetical protein
LFFICNFSFNAVYFDFPDFDYAQSDSHPEDSRRFKLLIRRHLFKFSIMNILKNIYFLFRFFASPSADGYAQNDNSAGRGSGEAGGFAASLP